VSEVGDRIVRLFELTMGFRIVMRPRVKGEETAGLQMPLIVKPISE
jgi:hypothetical protein